MSAFSGFTSGTRLRYPPLLVFLIGWFLELMVVAITLFHIMTSEAFIYQMKNLSVLPSLMYVLHQPAMLISGQLRPIDQEAFIWGYSIELLFMVAITGFEIVLITHHPLLAKIFLTIVLVTMIFDGVTDYFYGNVVTGPIGQGAFAFLVIFMLCFCGSVGTQFIKAGWRGMRKQKVIIVAP